MFVKDPGGQCWHAVVDSLLYCPAAHAVHDTAPDSLRVDVVQPASQTVHLVLPGSGWYLPGGHAAQATLESLLVCPATQAVQIRAPLVFNVSITDPFGHEKHLVEPVAALMLGLILVSLLRQKSVTADSHEQLPRANQNDENAMPASLSKMNRSWSPADSVKLGDSLEATKRRLLKSPS